MSDIINLLPDSVANQIAAGEVVQRPASVVKELLENSVDADSTNIKLIVKEAGKTLIQVIDNGKGMTPNDARMCFERHATSKLQKADDLFNLKSFGFRGEAMASIAAVSQVEVKTMPADHELGTHIRIEGSEIKEQQAISAPQGTNTLVKNLFFNVPARRNFLKSNPVELRHIMDEFHRVALTRPEISLSLYQNDMEVYNLKPANLAKRIVDLFGKNYQGKLVACEETNQDFEIKGFIGTPDSARKTRGDQFFIVNGRFIKHHYLHHAVNEAYKGLIQDGTHPFYVINISLNPQKIDVNVHPTKTEVKFEDERTLYAIILATVRQALATHNITPALDFDFNVNVGFNPQGGTLDYFSSSKESIEEENFSTTNIDRESSKPVSKPSWEKAQSYPSRPSSSPREQNNKESWQSLYQGFETDRQNFTPSPIEEQKTLSFEEDREEDENSEESIEIPVNFNIPTKEKSGKTFQLHNSYIITQVKAGLMLIDQNGAHERILFEKFDSDKNTGTSSQQCLFPQQVELTASDFQVVKELEKEIADLGFVISEFGHNTIVINGIPAGIQVESEKALFEGFIEQFRINRKDLSVQKNESLARALAKRSAIKKGKELSTLEMQSLIDKLFACSNPNYTPDGKPVCVILNMNNIQNYFV